jgi:hypothetical protein
MKERKLTQYSDSYVAKLLKMLIHISFAKKVLGDLMKTVMSISVCSFLATFFSPVIAKSPPQMVD